MKNASYIKYIVRNYPNLRRKLENLRAAQRREGEGGGRDAGGISRPVENTVLRELPPEEQRELEAVERAIDLTEAENNGEMRMKLVELAYWGRGMPLNRAAERLFIGYRTAQRYNTEFLRAVERAYERDGAGVQVSGTR